MGAPRMFRCATLLAALITGWIGFAGLVGAFELDGEYAFDSSSWSAKKVPQGHAFLCVPCSTEIRVQITYGPTSDELTPPQFREILPEEGSSDSFIKDVIMKQLPIKEGVEITVTDEVFGEFFGLEMLEFVVIVEFGGLVLRDTTFIGVHKNRIVKVTLNYVDGALGDAGREALNEIFSTLRFY